MGQAKRNKQRHCPALDETITPAVCGSNRNSTIVCTADCPHNPFNPDNYFSSYQEIEGKVVERLSRMLYGELDFSQKKKISNAVSKREHFVTNALHVWHLHGERRTETWRNRGDFGDWKNDELTVVRSLDTIRVALLEIQWVRDDRSTLVRDLLRPDEAPFVLMDATTASIACRFSVLLTWIYQMPSGHWRLSGIALDVPRTGNHTPREMFETIITHLGAPETGRDSWLLENMPVIQTAFTATASAQEARRYEISDLTTYERICRVDQATLRKLPVALLASPRIQDDGPDSSKAVFRGSLMEAPVSDDETMTCLGSIAVFPDGEIKLMSMGKENTRVLLDFMRNLAPRIEITSESLQDLARKRRESLPPWDAQLVPPALLENVTAIGLRSERIPNHGKSSLLTMMEHRYKSFADTAIPQIEDRSPREAACDPRLRPLLIELMKLHITGIDQQRRESGLDFDLNPILEELGLREIIQPPAPRGNIESMEDHDEEDEDFAEILMPRPQTLIEDEELDRRMDAVMADKELLVTSSTQIHELLAAMHDLSIKLNDLELQEVQVAACLAQALIHPTLPEDFSPYPDSMLARTESFLAEILKLAPEDSIIETMERIGRSTRQWEVLDMCVGTFNKRRSVFRKSKKPRPEMLLPMTIALCACICEITLWPPNPPA
jgi:hypothetical protein